MRKKEARIASIEARDRSFREQEKISRQTDRLKKEIKIEEDAIAKLDGSIKYNKAENERIAKWDAESKRIADEGLQYATQVSNYTKEVDELTKQLSTLRLAKKTKTRELLDSATEAELAAIAKRGAELEVQRMTEMVARKARGNALAKR